MAERGLIHETKIPEFSDWLRDNGWEILPLKGTYERIRARKDGALIIYHQRDKTDHLTSYGLGTSTSLRYLREKKRGRI